MIRMREYDLDRREDRAISRAEATVLVGASSDEQTQCAICEAFQAFMEEGRDPHLSPAVRPEIADSWVRSRAMGVDPTATQLTRRVSAEEREQTYDAYEELISTAEPLMGIIEDLGLSSDYLFELVSSNGLTLISEGNLDLHPYLAKEQIFDEESCGTNAHSLCMRHKTSIQVVGCEHYSVALHVLVAEAAPIMDENGVVIAALLLTQPLSDEPDSPTYRKLLSHALGLVTSIASTIEQRMRFVRVSGELGTVEGRYECDLRQVSRMQRILDMTVSASSDPILIADNDGVVNKMSPEAAHVIGRSSIDAAGSSVGSLFGISWKSAFGKLFEGARSASVKVAVRGRTFMLRGTAIEGAGDGEIDGVLLRLEERTRATESQQRGVGDRAAVTFEDILGESPQVATAKAITRRYALTSENVLIIGESGTGKELFAQAIHNESRPEGPFMSINCAAIPPRLIESELFGYESGAFTGAERGGKPGKIELSNGGTLFLDEIGDMPLELQATLLRVLENKRVMRLGGKSYKQVDFRVVAATNRDLVAMVREGTFREDLLYRLSILTVELPPLRERENDAVFFARYYLDECLTKFPGGAEGFTPEAEWFITTYTWPGNIRQLKNAVYSAYYACEDPLIDVTHFPSYALRTAERIGGIAPAERVDSGLTHPSRIVARSAAEENERSVDRCGDAASFVPCESERRVSGAEEDSYAQKAVVPPEPPAPTPESRPVESEADVLDAIEHAPCALSMAQTEKATIQLAMRLAEGNVKNASQMLGISKATLYRKLKEFGLE